MANNPVVRNTLANYAGRFAQVGISLATMPVQVHFLGMEAMGLLGFLISIQAILAILELRMGMLMNRALAAADLANPAQVREARDLLRTLELLYWGTGLLAGGLLAACATPIATHWITAPSLPRHTVIMAIALQGAVIALRWPSALYVGGFQGLQRQVRLNVLQSLSALLQGGVGIPILWATGGSLIAFQVGMVVVAAIQVAVFAGLLWAIMPAGPTARLALAGLRRHARFAVGTTLISLTSVALTQGDKMVLSLLLPLDAFGCYTVAWSLAQGLGQLSAPIAQAVFPAFTQRWAAGDIAGLAALYHRSSRLMAIVVLPAAALAIACAEPALRVYLGKPEVAARSAPVFALLIAGNACNALVLLPYYLQLAAGWTRLGLLVNVVAIAVMLPLMAVLALHFGLLGAGMAWLLLNLGYLAVNAPLMHRRLLPGELRRWYGADLGPPLAAMILGGGLAWLTTHQLPASDLLRCLVATGVIGCAALLLPDIRSRLAGLGRRFHRSPHV